MEEIHYYTRLNRYGRMADYASFNNIEFYKNEKYYVNGKCGLLHVYIYEYFNDCKVDTQNADKNLREVVHHKDLNPSNNHINNLQKMTRSEHNSLHHKEKIVSKEAKKKMSAAKKGNKYMLGKNHSQDAKNKISDAHKGNKNPNYRKETENEIEDIKNDIGYTKFNQKHNCSKGFYYRLKREYQELNN